MRKFVLEESQLLQIAREYCMQIVLVWLAVYLLVKLCGSKTVSKRFLLVSAAVYTVVFLFTTLLTRKMQPEIRYQLELFWEFRQAFAWEAGCLKVQNIEYVWYIENNILLFVPMGVLLGEWYRPHKRAFLWAMLTGFSVSLFVETSQLIFRLGLFEVDDLLNNSIGTVLGCCCCLLINKWSQSNWLRRMRKG